MVAAHLDPRHPRAAERSPPASYHRILEALAPHAEAFALALDDVEAAQDARAVAIAGHLGVRTARQLQDAVPLTTYDDLEPAIEAVARGEQPGLCPAAGPSFDVRWFEQSGGSSGPRRLLPMTDAFLAELQQGLAPWLFHMWKAFPASMAGPAYWSISPIGRGRPTTASGLSIGAAEDTAYFPPGVVEDLGRVMAVPGAVALMPDVEACRYATVRLLLQSPALAFVSVWSPTFLTLLMRTVDEHQERLLEDLAAGTCRVPGADSRAPARALVVEKVLRELPLAADPRRADRLGAVLRDKGRLDGGDLWPALALISLWTDAESHRFLPAIRSRFAGVGLQGKGLLATEGMLSLPWPGAPAPVLAARSHVVEFIDEDAPHTRPRLAHEVEPGRTYAIALSSSAGLLRYRLGDRVEVVGRAGTAPCFRFVGRGDAVSDLCGEKLSGAFVDGALTQALQGRRPAFAMLAPSFAEGSDRPHYRLYLELDVEDRVAAEVGRRLDEALTQSAPYGYARSLGQLGPVRVVRVAHGQRHYEAACIEEGQRAGDLKPLALHKRAGWDEVFAGRRLEGGA
jgi:hypothetical protein